MEALVAVRSGSPIRSPAIPRASVVLRDVSLHPKPLCLTCTLLRLCVPTAMEVPHVCDQVVPTRVRLRRGDTLFRPGDRFSALYAIRAGSCKTVLLAQDGNDQVSGYHMPGDILGADGIGTDSHNCQAVALEDTEVCVLPFGRIEELARNNHGFQHAVHRLLSREIARERNVMLMLGSMRAEQRLASFLLELSQRYQARGYSSSEFVLRMTREEIGSHLGMKLETVSRLLSRFHKEGVVHVQGRVVKLLDRVALMSVVDSSLQ
jgi:CRP/FNR family transcriptional regulator, anaerobic regulatory protein